MKEHGDLRLPACEKCRLRKIKCDNLSPKCSPCQRRKLACIIIDPSTYERYTRQSVQELEDRLKTLEAQANSQRETIPPDTNKSSTFSTDVQEPAFGTPFVGDGSGIK
jgi:Fungal Zn(2)-Cys(6) binuclear cluster domain